MILFTFLKWFTLLFFISMFFFKTTKFNLLFFSLFILLFLLLLEFLKFYFYQKVQPDKNSLLLKKILLKKDFKSIKKDNFLSFFFFSDLSDESLKLYSEKCSKIIKIFTCDIVIKDFVFIKKIICYIDKNSGSFVYPVVFFITNTNKGSEKTDFAYTFTLERILLSKFHIKIQDTNIMSFSDSSFENFLNKHVVLNCLCENYKNYNVIHIPRFNTDANLDFVVLLVLPKGINKKK